MGLMHASILGFSADVDIVAICEKNSLVRRFARKVIPGIRLVEDVRELASFKPDAVFITTPPASHYPIIKTIYDEKIAANIFTEKPLAVNFLQADELVNLAEKSGGANMVGYHRRFSVTFNHARKLLNSGEIGIPVSFAGHAYSADFLGARTARQAIGRGGVIEDSGCHIVDIIRWILGDLKLTDARVSSILGPGSQDEAVIKVETEAGTGGEIEASWCKPGYRLPDMSLSITATKGTLTVNEDMVRLDVNGGKTAVWYKHDLDDRVDFFIGGSEYRRQDSAFLRAVMDGGKVQPDFKTASGVDKLIDEANSLSGRNKS